MSVWVPVAVGIIGLIGVIAGQFINAWREDRRWKREQQREDVRWKRDLTKTQSLYRHDNEQKVRELRLELYSEILSVMAAIEANLMENIGIPSGAEETLGELHSANQKLIETASKLTVKIELTSTEAVSHSATVMKESIESKTFHLVRMVRDSGGVAVQENEMADESEIFSYTFASFNENQKKFIMNAQKELNIRRVRSCSLERSGGTQEL